MNPMIVAEIGGNHLGSYSRALGLVNAAWRAGADAVKFQCFTPGQMADPGVKIESGPWAGRDLLDLYRETHTPREWFPGLFAEVKESNMTPFASVFHQDDVDFLETLDCPVYKISSFELTDLALIRHAAKTGKPLIISTGMATRSEIFDAVVVAGGPNRAPVKPTLLKCTSAYPSEAKDANLLAMTEFPCQCPFGLSDHSLTSAIPVVAAVLGATVIEKHLILSRADGGPDAAFSLEPAEFGAMVRDVRDAVAAMGKVSFGPTDSEASSLPFRRKPGGKRGA
jgi:N-acetylneuraminate synthase